MATILQIKQDNNDIIRTAVGAGSILKTEDADLRDGVANELRDRGVIQVAATGDMATVSTDNTKVVAVKNAGLFVALDTDDDPNNSTTFASADAGWLWELWVATTVLENVADGTSTDQDYEYELDEGLSMWMVKVKPATSYQLKIGSTDGGEEHMSATPLTANQWNTFHIDVDAKAGNGDVSIFFTGVQSETIFGIYRVQLPIEIV